SSGVQAGESTGARTGRSPRSDLVEAGPGRLERNAFVVLVVAGRDSPLELERNPASQAERKRESVCNGCEKLEEHFQGEEQHRKQKIEGQHEEEVDRDR